MLSTMMMVNPNVAGKWKKRTAEWPVIPQECLACQCQWWKFLAEPNIVASPEVLFNRCSNQSTAFSSFPSVAPSDSKMSCLYAYRNFTLGTFFARRGSVEVEDLTIGLQDFACCWPPQHLDSLPTGRKVPRPIVGLFMTSKPSAFMTSRSWVSSSAVFLGWCSLLCKLCWTFIVLWRVPFTM